MGRQHGMACLRRADWSPSGTQPAQRSLGGVQYWNCSAACIIDSPKLSSTLQGPKILEMVCNRAYGMMRLDTFQYTPTSLQSSCADRELGVERGGSRQQHTPAESQSARVGRHLCGLELYARQTDYRGCIRHCHCLGAQRRQLGARDGQQKVKTHQKTAIQRTISATHSPLLSCQACLEQYQAPCDSALRAQSRVPVEGSQCTSLKGSDFGACAEHRVASAPWLGVQTAGRCASATAMARSLREASKVQLKQSIRSAISPSKNKTLRGRP